MLYHFVILSVLATQILSQQTKRIVNGIPTTASEFPFIASLRFDPDPANLTSGGCGGSLWRKEWPATIITAAHCYDDEPVEAVSLLRTDDDGPLGPGNMFLFFEAFGEDLHPQYSAADPTSAYDIALIYLNEDLSDNDELECVTIPDSCCTNLEPVTVIGYGAESEGGDPTDTLEFAELQYLDDTEQLCINSQPVADTSFCANAADADACQGDSGGPLVRMGTNVQVGIVSTGAGCNRPDTAGEYTDLAQFSEWVDTTLAAFIAANVGMMPTSAVTPAPVTPAPVTPAPVTPAPVTPAPVSPTPTESPAPTDSPAPTMSPAPTTSTAAPSGPVFDALVALYGETVATLIFNGQVPEAALAELVRETASEILAVIFSGDLTAAEVQQLLSLLNTSIAELILLEAGGSLSGSLSLSDSADSS